MYEPKLIKKEAIDNLREQYDAESDKEQKEWIKANLDLMISIYEAEQENKGR